VVDWTALWAGPSATRRLGASGAQVTRVEHPRRRDGLLAWPAGERWWTELNGDKELALLDAHQPNERRQLDDLVAEADILVTAMTPRALASLGFDDSTRERRAPALLHVELVGLDPPLHDSPALGEHAAAQAGLLWRGDHCPPARPYPWPDALLDVAATLVCRGWLASPRPRGGRIRLTLEGVARIAATKEHGSPSARGICT
jgi:crotonobetainyl-CoA:carnitine CoA-transferase CaiB-like acyl-CoA transferase